MAQSKSELEEWYSKPDPWGYELTADDVKRKWRILGQLRGKKFKRALDIGAGEGFITKDLPADEIHAIEISDTAAERIPKNIIRVSEPGGLYDLIIATGVLYQQYDWQTMTAWILSHANGVVITSHIASWEINQLPKEKLVYETEFPYREYTQHLCVYNFNETTP